LWQKGLLNRIKIGGVAQAHLQLRVTANIRTRFLQVLRKLNNQGSCVTPGLDKKPDVSHMCTSQVYTHMKDVIIEYIKDSVQQRK